MAIQKSLELFEYLGLNVQAYKEDAGTVVLSYEPGIDNRLRTILEAVGADTEPNKGILVCDINNIVTHEREIRLYRVDDDKISYFKDISEVDFPVKVDFSVLRLAKLLLENGYEIKEASANKIVLSTGRDHTLYDLLISTKDLLESNGIRFDLMAKDSIKGVIDLEGNESIIINNIDDRMLPQKENS